MTVNGISAAANPLLAAAAKSADAMVVDSGPSPSAPTGGILAQLGQRSFDVDPTLRAEVEALRAQSRALKRKRGELEQKLESAQGALQLEKSRSYKYLRILDKQDGTIKRLKSEIKDRDRTEQSSKEQIDALEAQHRITLEIFKDFAKDAQSLSAEDIRRKAKRLVDGMERIENGTYE